MMELKRDLESILRKHSLVTAACTKSLTMYKRQIGMIRREVGCVREEEGSKRPSQALSGTYNTA